MRQASCRNCKHCIAVKDLNVMFYCDFLRGFVYWKDVRERVMCEGEGFERGKEEA